jgi:hypothetical protein
MNKQTDILLNELSKLATFDRNEYYITENTIYYGSLWKKNNFRLWYHKVIDEYTLWYNPDDGEDSVWMYKGNFDEVLKYITRLYNEGEY